MSQRGHIILLNYSKIFRWSLVEDRHIVAGFFYVKIGKDLMIALLEQERNRLGTDLQSQKG